MDVLWNVLKYANKTLKFLSIKVLYLVEYVLHCSYNAWYIYIIRLEYKKGVKNVFVNQTSLCMYF